VAPSDNDPREKEMTVEKRAKSAEFNWRPNPRTVTLFFSTACGGKRGPLLALGIPRQID